MFIDRKVDQWHLIMGMDNWPKIGWLISQWHLTYSFYCLWWPTHFPSHCTQRSPVILCQRLEREHCRAQWLAPPAPNGGLALSETLGALALKLPFLCGWHLQGQRSQTPVISTTAFFIPKRRHDYFIGKNSLCLSVFIPRNHFFLSCELTL